MMFPRAYHTLSVLSSEGESSNSRLNTEEHCCANDDRHEDVFVELNKLFHKVTKECKDEWTQCKDEWARENKDGHQATDKDGIC